MIKKLFGHNGQDRIWAKRVAPKISNKIQFFLIYTPIYIHIVLLYDILLFGFNSSKLFNYFKSIRIIGLIKRDKNV